MIEAGLIKAKSTFERSIFANIKVIETIHRQVSLFSNRFEKK